MNATNDPAGENAPEVREIKYPENRVVTALEASAVDAAVAALNSAGLGDDEIIVITPDDVGHIESPLTETGPAGFIQRLILSLGVDLRMLERLREEVANEGRCIVMVAVKGDDQKDLASEVLKSHGAHALYFAGRWTIERL